MRRWRSSTSVTRAVVTFAAAGLAAVVLLGVLGVALLRRAGTDEAIRQAKQVTRLAGEGIVEPQLSDRLLAGDPRSTARLNAIVHRSVLRDPVVRVKLWTPDGRIVYSDEPRLKGARYALGADEERVLRHGGVEADVSDLSRPENRFERAYDKLLEVYLPVQTPSGRRLLFEAYLRFSSIAANGRTLWLAFAPALIGVLVVLWLVQLPLAWSLARRLREGQRQREALLRRALEASDVERRRVASDLHDGPVQSLAGVAYGMDAAAREPEAQAREALTRSATQLREVIRSLRALLVDIYPAALQREGLAAALADLTAPLSASGIQTRTELAEDLSLPPQTQELLYRAAQETLRNVLAHAQAHHVDIRVSIEDRIGALFIADDGTGFRPEEAMARSSNGHFGLRLLADLANDSGGKLDVDSAPGRGTRIRLEVPLP